MREEALLENIFTSSIYQKGTGCIFQTSVHNQKDFESKFCIQIIEDPRPFKYYSYFDYFNFFEFYQIHKTNYNLDVGVAFHDYLAKNNTEMFTVFKKFTDPNGKYKGAFDHTIYFLVQKTGHVIILRTDQNLLVCIPKTFVDVFKKDNDKVIFDLLITTLAVQDRETIYNGMKSNVVHYSLKPLHTEYEYLDNEYLNIDLASMQGNTQSLDRFLFPKKLIEERCTKKFINFNLTDVTGDQRLLELLPPKTNDFYPLSKF